MASEELAGGLSRRGAIALGLTACASRGWATRRSWAELTVAAPRASALGDWARRLAPGLAEQLPGGISPSLRFVGGIDGVTGANQFAAHALPDGLSALLLPGSACIAQLTGDPRAQYDQSAFIAVAMLESPGFIAARKSPSPRPSKAPLRVACAKGTGVVAWLGLSLLGHQVRPAVPTTDWQAAVSADLADAVFVHGPERGQSASWLAQAGLSPLCTTEPEGDPDLPGLPSLSALARGAAPDLLAAWNAVARAGRLEFALVLPRLTTATMVQAWTGAIVAAESGQAMLQHERALSMRVGALAASRFGAAPSPAALAALRAFIGRNEASGVTSL